ncbi:hypothetical protein [Paenibacillus sp. IHBB 10380]|uniref:hypothetical protein n=1 Tax=Paenibacillus sp. IHBB 10380 TaxID=1566358 RepID=UPI0005CFEC25|nr:hypothetical protein [Paenibacillus sp. IHBB 10380]AJS57269.1 hypothetical protein UB51_00760 [Paenibacillus sp. IHBB 10380]
MKIATTANYLLLFILIFILVITGCGQNKSLNTDPEMEKTTQKLPTESILDPVITTADTTEGKVITSDDKRVEVTIPTGWLKKSELGTSLLTATDQTRTKYLTIVAVPKTDLASNATLVDFEQANDQQMEKQLEQFKSVRSKPFQIDSRETRLMFYSGMVDQYEIIYWIAVFETENSFYQVVLNATNDLDLSTGETFREIAQSLKILDDSKISLSNGDSSNFVKTVKSEDGRIQINLPRDWRTKNVSIPGADIQAVHADGDETLSIFHEPKGNFDTDTSIYDYYDLIIDQYYNKKEVKNITITKPRQVEINGLSALQFEIHSEINKLKIANSVTLLESSEHFTQIKFWITESLFDDKIALYLKLTQSYVQHY